MKLSYRALVGLPPSNQLYLETKLPTPRLLEVTAAAAVEKQAKSRTTSTNALAGDSDIESDSLEIGEQPVQD